ncbi:MAG: 5-(carboxyamino)imidazole ribonucleotide mutase [Candidatus Aminicenantes bacterium]|nr:5-(carboxyamino)imidazole ribonucleotide mutase [Candidatus Aminicenantes bacterium]
MNRVAIFIGSESDYDVIQEACRVLEGFGVAYSLDVTSAHRSPERTLSLVRKAEEEGVSVFIAAAGKAAHLAGVVAAHTLRPVIGVPVESAGLGGLDALLSTVQMPKGVPVATVALGKTGAANAAYLAVQVLSLADPSLGKKLAEDKKRMAAAVEESSRALREKRKKA